VTFPCWKVCKRRYDKNPKLNPLPEYVKIAMIFRKKVLIHRQKGASPSPLIPLSFPFPLSGQCLVAKD